VNQSIQKYLKHSMISFRLFLLLALLSVLVSCAVTPTMVRKFSTSRDMQLIAAKRPLVAACISQQFKATTSYVVVEEEDSLQINSGENTLRIYDLEDWVGGTMVTIFEAENFGIEEARLVIDYCRKQLESPKPPPRRSAK